MFWLRFISKQDKTFARHLPDAVSARDTLQLQEGDRGLPTQQSSHEVLQQLLQGAQFLEVIG